MPKVKREDLSPTSSDSGSLSSPLGSHSDEDEHLELDMINSPAQSSRSSNDESSSLQRQQPGRKKFKTALNPFSIEAIMQQSTSPTRSTSSSLEHHHHQNHNQTQNHIDPPNHHLHHPQQQQRSHTNQRSSPATTPLSQATSSAAAAGSSNSSSSKATPATAANNRLNHVGCTLDNQDMWDKFHSLNTEMIITKTGRRMFPVMKVQFHNLDPNARYAVSMDIIPVDNKRYRYAYHKSCWQVAGKADPSAEPRLYPHPDSPFNGDLLSRQVISFEKVKLTNNEMDKSGHIILNSMHKYQPRVHLIELKLPQQQPTSNGHNSQFIGSSHQQQGNKSNSTYSDRSQNHNHQSQSQQQPPPFDIEGYKTFVFPETVFTAVTAYQNQLITKMKIDKNPFAKGFRDSSRLSDLDRNDPFDYMGPLSQSGRFGGPSSGGGQSTGSAGGPGSLDGPPGSHMDAFHLLANHPWYSAAALAAAASGGAGALNGPGGNPYGLMGACGSAQATQLNQMMFAAAFSAFLNGGATAAAATAGNTAAIAGTSNNHSPEDK